MCVDGPMDIDEEGLRPVKKIIIIDRVSSTLKPEAISVPADDIARLRSFCYWSNEAVTELVVHRV